MLFRRVIQAFAAVNKLKGTKFDNYIYFDYFTDIDTIPTKQDNYELKV